MPTTTPAQALRVPISTDNPDVVDDMTQLALQIEKRLVGVYATVSARNSATTAAGVVEGMFAYTMDANKFWYYDGAAWQPFPPTAPSITSGTAGPSGGVDGDIYFKV
jgi:hypothetical protein